MEIEGIIIMDLPLEEGVSKAGNPWKKKGWVLETQSQYPRKVKFDVFGDRVNTLTFEVGKNYAVSVDVESREFNGRWYTDLRAFNCRVIEGGAPAIQQQPGFGQPAPQYGVPQSGPQFGQAAQEPAPFMQSPGLPASDETEDLPF